MFVASDFPNEGFHSVLNIDCYFLKAVGNWSPVRCRFIQAAQDRAGFRLDCE